MQQVSKSDCDLCGKQYQMDQGRYEGNKLELYGAAFCCDTCWKGNWDGWGPIREPRIIQICEEKNIPIPPRNEKGWLPRN